MMTMMMMVEVIMMIVVVVLVHLFLTNLFFKSIFKKLFGILGWDILDVIDFFLFECCIHNRLARRMQIQEPMVLLLLGEAS